MRLHLAPCGHLFPGHTNDRLQDRVCGAVLLSKLVHACSTYVGVLGLGWRAMGSGCSGAAHHDHDVMQGQTLPCNCVAHCLFTGQPGSGAAAGARLVLYSIDSTAYRHYT